MRQGRSDEDRRRDANCGARETYAKGIRQFTSVAISYSLPISQ